jgi:hypothetical protein
VSSTGSGEYDRRLADRRLPTQGDSVVKKLLILLILVAIGIAVARKVREV